MNLHLVVLRISRSAFFLICLITDSLFAAQAPWVGQTHKGIPCWGASQGFGPFDYTNPRQRQGNLELVEIAHFSASIEQLTGPPDVYLRKEIDYTLRAFPNHHRALKSMMRLQIRMMEAEKINRIRADQTPVECYFERAINFNPNDGVVRILYGIYLHKQGKHSTALKHYQAGEKFNPENTELNYNLALLYIELKRYEKARRHAVKAYQAGYPLQGVKNKLKSLGFWKKP